jgi:hypothetical protein
MSSTLHEFYDAHRVAAAEPAHGLRCGQGQEGRSYGGHALSRDGRGRAQRAGESGRAHQDLPLVAEQGSQARQSALHIHLWLNHMKTAPRGSASSKRAATDQGGPGAAGSGQGRKEGKYTLEAALGQLCKFHSSPGREATHSMCQCRFMRELEQCAQ